MFVDLDKLLGKFAHFGKLLAPVTHICLRSMKKDDSRE